MGPTSKSRYREQYVHTIAVFAASGNVNQNASKTTIFKVGNTPNDRIYATMTIRTSTELVLADHRTLPAYTADRTPSRVEYHERDLFGVLHDGDDDSFLSDHSDGHSDDSSLFYISISDFDDDANIGATYDEQREAAFLNTYVCPAVGGGATPSSDRHAIQSLLTSLKRLTRIEDEWTIRQNEEDADSLRLARARGIRGMRMSRDEEGNKQNESEDEDEQYSCEV
jgi:hypothetical protein